MINIIKNMAYIKHKFHIRDKIGVSAIRRFMKKWGTGGIRKSLARKKLRRERQRRSTAYDFIMKKSQEKGIFIADYLNQRFSKAHVNIARAPFYRAKINHQPTDLSNLPKLIAFYLPQFHPIKENNLWWGEGFTEWSNVSKAQPQFTGHNQPQLPADLGFYDLRLESILKDQRDLAKNYGVSGFCFHYYWFGGKRLLETPIDNFLKNKTIDLEFCYCWANENWTRRWDGREQDVLIEQKFSPEDDINFIDELIESFSDTRYIKIKGKPLLIVYRASLLPDAKGTVERWQKRAREHGMDGIYLVAARSNKDRNPLDFGFDAAVEFPPHQGDPIKITSQVNIINRNYQGDVWDYIELSKRFGKNQEESFRLFKTVMPDWDNEARKPGNGHTFHGSTPAAYAGWLNDAIQVTKSYPKEEQIVFINAWNEWAEGAHLEPDTYSGHAYLEATWETLINSRSNLDRHTFLSSEQQPTLEGNAMKNDRQYYQQNRSEVTSALPKNYSKVLEVGCGEGVFRANLKDDCEYWGVEYSKTVAEIAAKKLNRVLAGAYDDCAKDLPQHYFDLVICNDVIEHMQDHHAFLLSVKEKIAPGGAIIGSIPNIRHWSIIYELIFRRDWKYQQNGILDNTHLRFFTKKSWRRSLEEAGYEIEYFEGINSRVMNSTPVPKRRGKILRALLGKESRYLQFSFRARPRT